MSWLDVWQRKGQIDVEEITLSTLIKISGFDTVAGQMDDTSWRTYVGQIQNRLAIKPSKKLLEVGCGASAFLYPSAMECVSES